MAELSNRHTDVSETEKIGATLPKDYFDGEKVVESLIDFSVYPEYSELDKDEKTRLRLGDSYHVDGRQVVGYDEDDADHYLVYCANDNLASKRRRSFKYIRTGKSENDDGIKNSYRNFCLGYGILAITSLLAGCGVALMLPNGNTNGYLPDRILYASAAQLALTLLGLFGFRYFLPELKQQVITNFTTMSKWMTAGIEKILGTDIGNKFKGVRNTMLVFRQFVKWRRYLNFFSAVAVYARWSVIVICTAIFFAAGLFLVWVGVKPEEMILFPAVAALCIWLTDRAVERRIDWLKDVTILYSDGRDPTVPLCVLIAEMHDKYVNRNSGAAAGT